MENLADKEFEGFVTLSDLGGLGDGDRRSSKRMPYSCTALVATHDGHSFPDATAFWEVQCHDLSQGGISFYSARKPPRASLVIRLPGSGEVNVVMSARIAHCRFVDHQGGAYLVGCQFLERLA